MDFELGFNLMRGKILLLFEDFIDCSGFEYNINNNNRCFGFVLINFGNVVNVYLDCSNCSFMGIILVFIGRVFEL